MIMNLLTTITSISIFVLHPLKSAHAQSINKRCSVDFTATCSSLGKESVSKVSFQVRPETDNKHTNNSILIETEASYEATVIFQWGNSSQVLSNNVYPTGQLIELSSSHIYEETGLYRGGYELTFGKGAGSCENKTSSILSLIQVEERACDWGVETDVPSLAPIAFFPFTSAGSTNPQPDFEPTASILDSGPTIAIPSSVPTTNNDYYEDVRSKNNATSAAISPAVHVNGVLSDGKTWPPSSAPFVARPSCAEGKMLHFIVFISVVANLAIRLWWD